MEALVNQIENFAESTDDVTRRKLCTSLRKIAASIEPSNDIVRRIVHQPYELAVCQVAADLGIFKMLSESSGPVTTDEIAANTGADPLLMTRIMRLMAAFLLVNEDSEGTFSASQVTRALAHQGSQGGISHHFYLLNPILQILPKWLKEHKYQNPENSLDCPFQMAFKTDLPVFIWMNQMPEYVAWFAPYMKDYHNGKPIWTTAVHLRQQCLDWKGTNPVFVDVGGGMGFQSVEFQKAVPEVPGKIILQELQPTLDKAPQHVGIERMVHDFFTPQPVKGAKYYYFRNILHDYPDELCVKILTLTKNAMGPDSVILIDEIIVPSIGVDRQIAQMDLTMMLAFGSMERTEKQWRNLFSKAGLEIKNIGTYAMFSGDSILEVTPRSENGSA